MKKVFLKSLAIGLMALIPAFSWAGEKLVNNGSYTNTYVPIYGSYASSYTRVQWIQPSSDLTALKDSDITAMTFYASTTSGSWGDAEWDVYVFETTSTSVSSGYLSTASAAKVYSGKLSVSSSKMNIVFDDSYTYKGGNLVVDLSQKTKGTSSSVNFYYQSGSYGASRYGYNYYSLASVSGSSSYNRPKMTISYEPTPTCKKTKNIIVEDLTSTSATIKWNKVADAVSYDVTVGTNEFLGLTDTVQAVSGLSPNTEYTVSVVTNCSGDKGSSAAKSATFRTECAAVSSFPWTEEFSITSGIPDCWDNSEGTVSNDSHKWNYYATGKTGACVRFNSFNPSSGQYNILKSPELALPTEAQQLSFYYKNPTGGNCELYVNDSLMATYGQVSSWTLYEVPLVAFVNKTVTISWKGISNCGIGNAYLDLDGVSVSKMPTCVKPTISGCYVFPNKANIEWKASGMGETQYQYVVVAKGSTPDWNNATLVSALSAEVSSLAASTDYDFYVRSYCSPTDQSESVKASFTTPCAAVTSLIEDFELMTLDVKPTCWDNSASTTTTLGTNPKFVWGVYSYSNNKMIRLYNYNTLAGTALINTPYVSIPSDKDYELIFDYSHTASCGNFLVKISKNGGKTFDQLASYAKGSGSSQNDPGQFTNVTFDLSSYKGETIFVQFFANSNNGSGAIFVDNIKIREVSNCKKPTALAAKNLTANSATLSWTAGDAETAWNIRYRESGVVAWLDTIAALTNPFTLTGLKMGTDYEVQIQAACSATETSDWTDAKSFTTACSALTLGTIFGFEDVANDALPLCWFGNNAITSSYYTPYDPVVVTNATYSHTGSKSLQLKNNKSYCKPFVSLPKLPDDVNVGDLQVTIYSCCSDGYNSTALEIGLLSDPMNLSTFKSAGKVISESNTSGTINVIDFSSLANYNANYRYICICYVGYYSTNYTFYLDDIQVAPKPKAPFNLRAEDITKTKATIKFAQEDSKGKWNLQVATDKEFKSVVDSKVITDSTAALTGLSGSTNYFVRVQHVDTTYNVASAWVNADFTTECDAKTTPYSEDFTGTSVPACWTAVSESANFPSVSSNKLYMGAAGAAFLPELNFTGIEGIENAMISFEASADKKEIKVILVADPKQLTFADLASQTVIGSATLGTDAKYYEFFVSDVLAADRAGKNYIGLYAAEASYISLDNLKVKAAENRLPEFGTAVVTASTATIPFTQKNDDEGGWTVQYGTDKNFATKTEVAINPGATQEIALTGLTENTTYYVRIQQAMDDDVTHWATTSFTTECAKTEFDKVYGFENFNATSSKSYSTGSTSYFSSCWTRGNKYNSGNYYMPYAYSGEKYLGNNSLIMWGNSSNASYFAMPAFAETQDMTEVLVTFYAKADNASYKKLQIGTTSGITAVNTPNFTKVGEVALTTGWAKYEVSFEDYEGNDQLIMFYYGDGSNSYACYIDNIELKKITCKRPKSKIGTLTSNSAVLNAGLKNVSNWAWKFAGAQDSTVVYIPDTSTTITGLIADTDYKVLVQAQCGEEDGNSRWDTVTFRTPCEAIVALGYTEDFTDGISTCMKAIKASYNQYGTKYVTLSSAALVLPVYKSNTDWSTLQLSFNGSTNSNEKPNVKIIAYEEGAELANQEVLATVALNGVMSGQDVYFDEIADINTKLAGKRLGFYREEMVGVCVDDIAIKAASSFKAPKNLAMVADSETAEGASFTFVQTGTPTNVWVVEVSTAISFTKVAKYDTISTTSFNLTGLELPGTAYYVRVKQLNGEESSNYSNIVAFTTKCTPLALNKVIDFEAYNSGTGTPSSFQIGCWGFYSGYAAGYEPFVYKSTTYNHTAGGQNSMQIKAYSSSKPSMFTLPQVAEGIDMKLVTVTFSVRTASSYADLKVGVMDNADTYSSTKFKQAKSCYVNTTSATIDVTFSEVADLTEAYKYIAFVSESTTAIYVDDIVVTVYCAKADGAAASEVTATSATISITNATPNWNVVVKAGETIAFEQDSILEVSVSATGLSAETTYEAIITMNCAGGVVSDPDTVEFTTSAVVWELLRGELAEGQIGTTCQGKNITAVRGGALYGVNYGTTQSVEFAEKSLPIAAGEPLLFQADGTNEGKIEVVYGSATADVARHDEGKKGVNGLVGLVSGTSVAIEAGNILVSGGRLRLTGDDCLLTAGHAYIEAEELPTQSTAPARARRLILTQNGTAVATGTDEVMNGNMEGVKKIVRDGQLIIIRGGQLYNAQGQVLR